MFGFANWHSSVVRQVLARTLRWARARLALAVWVVLALGQGTVALAQQEPDYAGMALRWAQSNAASALPLEASHLRLEISVGALDSRLRLAPCGNIEPYLAPGARLWGRSRVGLRCVDGMTRWNVSVPVTVKAYGNAWVVRSQILFGTPLAQGDLVLAEVDWAEDTNPVVADASMWVGQTATRTMTTGQVLRMGMVRPTQVFQAGTQIRVVAEGAGFQISGDAQALSAGVIGQMARVRMDNGRIASGTVLDARTVKIAL